MEGSEVYNLTICIKRYENLMTLSAAEQRKEAAKLQKYMQEVYVIPERIDPIWEAKYGSVLDLYEKVCSALN